jgi:Cys-rich protein (TIGR01571 family)
MGCNLPFIVAAVLVTSSLGKFRHLRVTPSLPNSKGSLVTEATPVAKPVDTPTSSWKSLSGLLSIVKRPTTEIHPDSKAALSDHKALFLMNTGEIVATFVIWLFFYCLLAAYYHSFVLFYAPENEAKEEMAKINNYKDFQDFTSGLFECNKHHGITFWSCCCPGIRWADTMNKLGIHGFWGAFWFLTMLYCISFIPYATAVCYIIVVCYMAYHRQEFRRVFEFTTQGGSSIFSDLLTYCCCMCCAVAQEARHTRKACTVAHKAIINHGTEA